MPTLEARRSGRPHEEDRDALLDAKDETIVELRAQVALLRNELRRKDALLSRLTESISELSARVSDAANGSRRVVSGGTVWADDPASNGQQGLEKPERPKLPEGYRVVAVASDAWVLVTSRGVRVAGYRGELDLHRVASEAREHHQRG